MLTLSVSVTLPWIDFNISRKEMTEAAGRGVSNVLIRHLRARNAQTKPNRNHLPKSNYYAQAADSVTTEAKDGEAIVTIRKEGVRLHWLGGEVRPRPGKRALAIPVDPSVATVWPSEAAAYATGGTDDARYALVWPKGSNHGWIKDTETGNMMWLLVPRVRIKADPTVLPDIPTITRAAQSAVEDFFA